MTTTKTAARFGIADIGVYFDGARGVYIGEAVQELAQSFGWKYSSQFEMVNFDDDYDGESYSEAWDEAEEFLNTLTSDDTYFGGFPDGGGDWGLMSISDDDQGI